ncbi:hypothetical protein CsSME_00014130 [Camellia sinensis var. sinensis]
MDLFKADNLIGGLFVRFLDNCSSHRSLGIHFNEKVSHIYSLLNVAKSFWWVSLCGSRCSY